MHVSEAVRSSGAKAVSARPAVAWSARPPRSRATNATTGEALVTPSVQCRGDEKGAGAPIPARTICAGTQLGGSTNPSCGASLSAHSLFSTVFLAKLSSAVFRVAGGPRTRNSRGGGRSSNMFRMRVTRENMT